MFTFSFGTAMAETNYTASDYANALTAEMNNQLTYLSNAKVKYLNDLSYNNLGYEGAAKDVISGYTRASIEAGLDAAIASLTAAMQGAISTAANAVPASGTTIAPDLTVVKNAAVNDATDAINGKKVSEAIADMGAICTLEKAVIEKAQAPLTKAAVEAQLAAVDYSKYNTVDKDYVVDGQKVSAAEKVQSLVDAANKTMADAAVDTGKTDEQKRTAYEGAYTTFVAAFNAVPTLEDEAQTDNESSKTVAGAVNEYLQYGIQTVYPAIKLVPTTDSSVYKLQDGTKTLILSNESFYTAKNSTSKAKLFGVEIANIDRITKAEALAVNDAMYKAILESADVVKAYAGTDAGKVAPLYTDTTPAVGIQYTLLINAINDPTLFASFLGAAGKLFVKNANDEYVEVNWAQYYAHKNAGGDAKVYKVTPAVPAGLVGNNTKFLATLGNAMDVADVYEDVVALGEKYKAEVSYGVKVYDDAKVDAAVKEAKDLVYGDLNSTLKKPYEYIEEARIALEYDSLKAVNYEYQKFKKAIADAKAKFYKADGSVQVKVLYGDDKTAEADYVYLKGTYAADTETVKDWKEAADDAVKAINNAESYADIDAALAAAKEAMSKLTLATEATKVATAKTNYKAALGKYIDEQKSILGDTEVAKYSKAFAAVKTAGDTLIDDATSVAGVEKAYADAQALVKALKTDDELKAEKNAVIAQIAALPAKANLTVADKEKVMAVFDAYQAYVETPGAAAVDITNETTLEAAVKTVLDAQAEALGDKIAATKKAIDKLYETSDIDAKAIAEMRAEMEALTADVTAFNDELEDIKEVASFDDLDVDAINNDYIEGLLASEAKVWDAEYRVANVLAVAATKADATVAQMNEALDAYKALTDRQRYAMDADYLELIKRVEANLADAVQALKITASSKATKGAITVKWTVKEGDVTAADGFQVWKSTKMNSGYKKAFTTTKTSYKNTKGLKKGTKYYYKVRAYKVVDGKNVYSDWSNKAYRAAK